ncbi:hypothetical protein [Nocardioides iriomotensis]|uniref:Uncharacterized protein n=1 Tax=Nocardioides iriomotensis TaxID=715784 RepID=A0A4Q5JAA1_9ACTN|nr:hypothetical protein [Nocardioides iriomotensis]RYU14831.1 hypothetical protein ETU37_02255 [Nocardioides iriomotensis]
MVFAVGVVGVATPSASAGDNDRSDWSGKRALKAGVDEAALQLATGRSAWALMARELGRDADDSQTWRLRERSNDGVWRNPANLPAAVTDLTYETGSTGHTFGAYVSNGRLHGFTHPARASTASDTDLGAAAAGVQPKVTVMTGGSGTGGFLGVIRYAGNVYEWVNGQTGNDGWHAGWRANPESAYDVSKGAPIASGPFYEYDNDGRMLAFYTEQGTGDLMAARRDKRTGIIGSNPGAQLDWSDPQKVADDERFADFASTTKGERIVTQTDDQSVVLHDLSTDDATDTFATGNRRVLAGPLPQQAGVTTLDAPRVVVDGRGDLTIGWRERIADDGAGLVLWQENRPQGKYLERPTFIGGTRDSQIHWAVAPSGTITIATQPRTDRWSSPRIKHLAAGKSGWTKWLTVAPAVTADSWSDSTLGVPRGNGDLTLVTNDGRGVYATTFDAPRAVTKMTRPTNRKVGPSYTIAFNTTWAYASDWQVRARVDNGKRSGAWKTVAVRDGQRFKDVTRKRGEKRCYQARGETPGGWTKWSKQRCVTVRR